MLILTLLIPDTKGNGTGTCKYIRLIRSDILVPYDDHLTMVCHDKTLCQIVTELQLTTCISPFSPGRGGHGFERDPFSLELDEQWSKVSTI